MASDRWIAHRAFIADFQQIRIGDDAYNNLIASGIDQSQLDAFILSGSKRKRSKHPLEPVAAQSQFHALLVLGGHVAGGAALQKWLFSPNSSDIDIFFNNCIDWVRATLAVHDNPALDICLFDSRPYEGFDLVASQCSYSRYGWDVSPHCEQAFVTKTSNIIRENIIHPIFTLNRVVKYAERYGMKFSRSDLDWLVSRFKVTDLELVSKAISYSTDSL